MEPVLEHAASGRAKCRGCGTAIAKGELRIGDRLPNPFAEDREMTWWFHVPCAVFKRPEPAQAALLATDLQVDDKDVLLREAGRGLEHRRLPRIDGAQRAPTGRAACRACREPIAKDAWRIKLVYFEDARFAPAGYVHLGCAAEYFGTGDLLPRIAHFTPSLDPDARIDLARELPS